MKIYAIYDSDNKFIVAFPSRKEAEDYGKTTFGNESGWSYAIVEKYLHDYPKFIDTKPSTLYASQHIPCEQNIPDIWGKSGFTVDYTQTPKIN